MPIVNKSLREILTNELKETDALNCVWGKIPDDAREDLINLICQKMDWAYRRGQDDGPDIEPRFQVLPTIDEKDKANGISGPAGYIPVSDEEVGGVVAYFLEEKDAQNWVNRKNDN